MLAQVLGKFGDVSNFTLLDVPRPEVRPGHVLIRVAATSVNPADYKIRRAPSAIAPDLPGILGIDFAGVVEESGDGVDDFSPGDEVYGCGGGVKGIAGALAEYLVADVRLIARKPQSLTMREAAALPLVSITAWEALYDRAAIEPGQTVLVHAGSGGVGSIGVQLAKLRGARVFTTVSSEEKGAAARSLGADEVIYYLSESPDRYVGRLTEGRGFDVVFDAVGGANLDVSFHAARLNGTVVSISTQENHNLSIMHAKGLTLHVVFMLIPLLYNIGREHQGFILREIAALVDSGKLHPLLDERRFTLADTPEAHRYIESGKAAGKVVIEVNGSAADEEPRA